MHTDRRTILFLVAVGRITPAEAERLLLAWNEGREILWALGVCMVVTVLAHAHPDALLPDLLHLVHPLRGNSDSARCALSLVNRLLGGVV